MELDELTNSNGQQDPNIYSDTEARCLSKVSLSLNVEEKAHSPYDNIAGV